jgi:hypothetical protein
MSNVRDVEVGASAANLPQGGYRYGTLFCYPKFRRSLQACAPDGILVTNRITGEPLNATRQSREP